MTASDPADVARIRREIRAARLRDPGKVAAFDAAFAAEAAPDEPPPPAPPPPPPPPAAHDIGPPARQPVPPAPHPEPHPDVVHMPAAELDALRDAATAPERHAAQQAAAEHEQLVIAAVRDGRIEPRHRDSWLQVLNADPAAIVDLLGLPTGRSDIPLDEIGHAGNGDDENPLTRLWPR